MMMSGSCRISARTPSAKARSICVLHLHLVEGRLDHLDRVLDGADVHLRRGERLERRVERGGLARAGRAGDQHDAVAAARPCSSQRCASSSEKPSSSKSLHHHVGVEDAHHHLFAEGGGQRRQAQLDLVRRRGARLDAAVLRPALLDHVHAAEDLDARGHRGRAPPAASGRPGAARRRCGSARCPCSRRGSRWMSLARCSNAYCHSQSTMLTMCGRWRRAACRLARARPAARSCAVAESAVGLAGALDRLGQVEELDLVALDVDAGWRSRA